MPTRYDRNVDTSRDDRGGWQQHGDFGRTQSYDDDDDRGWFDRVRDTASRWFHGRDDDDDRDDDRNRYPDRNRNDVRYRDDDRNRFRAGGDEGSYRSRDDMDRWERRTFDRDHQRNWQDDDATLGRRGDIGLSGRTPYDRYDERGRFSGFARDDERNRMYGEGNRYRPLGDERNDRDRQDQDRDRYFGGGDRDRQGGERNRPYGSGDRYRPYGSGDRYRPYGSGDRYRPYGSDDRDRYDGGSYERGSQYGGQDDQRGYGRTSVRSFVGEDHRMSHDEHRQGRDDHRQQYGQAGSYGRDDYRGFGRSDRSFGRDDHRERNDRGYPHASGRPFDDRDEYSRRRR